MITTKFESAISNMLKNAGLTGAQAIVNTTTHMSVLNIAGYVYFKRTAYATAYVIEFTD